jgi:pimeloyl-ACP methyl ester carboxylesterase
VLGEEPVELIGHSWVRLQPSSRRSTFHTASSLTLVAPFFLQPRAGLSVRMRPLIRSYLRRVDPARLSLRLTGSTASATALESTVSDLRRTGAMGVALSWRLPARPGGAALRDALEHFDGPIRIIAGSEDPLIRARQTMSHHVRTPS